MNAHQISLNLVAQLDQGNIQSQTSQMAMNMARAIESAFQGIGTQIAASILAGVRQGLQGSIEMIGQTRIGLGGGNVPVTESERQVMASAATQSNEAKMRDLRASMGIFPEAPVPQPQPFQAPSVGAGAQMGPAEEVETEGGFVTTPRTRRRARAGMGEMAGRAAGAIGIAGEAIGLLGELPGIQRQAAASRAETEDLSGRALMRGDFEGAILQQRMGGREAMREQATTEETGKLVKNVLTSGAIATVLAGVAGVAAVAAAPITGGLSLAAVPGLAAAAGVATGGMALARGVAGFDTAVQGNIQGRTEAERQREFEFTEMTRRGRETAVGAYHGAQAMGGPEFAPMMAGLGMPQVGGMDIRQFAVQQGLSTEQFQQTMGGFAGLGGLYGGGGPALAKEPELLGRALTQVGQGFTQLPQVAQGMVQGGMSPVDAVRAAADMFEKAVTSGMDKAKAGEALLRMSQRAEQMGVGGGGAAETQMTQAMGLAQQMFPGGEISPAQQLMAERLQQFGQQGATRGFEMMSNLTATRGAERRFGIHQGGQRGDELETYLSRQTVTGAGVKKLEEQVDENGKPLFPGLKAVAGHEEEFAAEVMKERAQQRVRTRERFLGKTSARAGFVTANVAEGAPLEQVGAAIAGEQVMGREGTMAPGIPIETDPNRLAGKMPSPEQFAAQQKMKETAVATAATDAAVISKGLNTLAEQLPAINTAFQELLAKIKSMSPGGGAGDTHHHAASTTGKSWFGSLFPGFDTTTGQTPPGS